MKHYLLTIILLNSLFTFGQKVTISATRNNILYRGIENPLEIVVENMHCGKFVVTSNNGIIENYDNCLYSLKSVKLGKAKISVYKIKGNDSILIGTSEFRIRNIPDPIPKVANQKGGKISKNLLSAQLGIRASMEEFDMDFKVDINSYTVIIIRSNDSITFKEFKGQKFPDELISDFSKLQPNDRVYFEDIVAIMPDERKILMKGLRLEIE